MVGALGAASGVTKMDILWIRTLSPSVLCTFALFHLLHWLTLTLLLDRIQAICMSDSGINGPLLGISAVCIIKGDRDGTSFFSP
jgi:hypothetical protein